MKEGDKYKISIDYYNYIELEVTYVSSPYAYLKFIYAQQADYKYNLKTHKLYKWNGFEWNVLEYDLKEKTFDDVWLERQQNKFLGD